ncbi:MAG TPA: acetylglutamate kinase [bacterium]|nr:acetylglutamate kinase [bacterium]
MEDVITNKAKVLVEAYRYIQRYKGKIFVLKAGGSILKIKEAKENFLFDISFLSAVGIKSLVVCGGGPLITEEMEKKGKKAEFIEGIRVTDSETLNIARKILSDIRDEFVNFLREKMGVKAEGLEPEERFLIARKIHYQRGEEVIDLGFVGQIEYADVDYIKKKFEENDVLVVIPLAYSKEGVIYNVNADLVAYSLATNMKVEKLIFLTNVSGVMRNPENQDTLIPILKIDQAENLINKGIIDGGMIPKVKAGIKSVKEGVEKVHIISGNIPHSILLEVFTDEGIGTEIVK